MSAQTGGSREGCRPGASRIASTAPQASALLEWPGMGRGLVALRGRAVQVRHAVELRLRQRLLARTAVGIQRPTELEYPHRAVPEDDVGVGIGLRPAPLGRVVHAVRQVWVEG